MPGDAPEMPPEFVRLVGDLRAREMSPEFELLANELWRHSYRGAPGWNGAIANLWAYVQGREKAAYNEGVDAMKNAVLGVLIAKEAPDAG